MIHLSVAYGVNQILALIIGVAFVGQTGTATGKVVDGDGKPVSAVIVRFEARGNVPVYFESKTNEKGEFLILTSQIDGPWLITVKKQGHIAHIAERLIVVPMGGAAEIPTITLWVEGDKRAPIIVTEEEAKAQRKALDELKLQVDQAVSLVNEGQAAQQAGDKALARQKYDAAEVAYKAMIEKYPQIPEMHFNLGVIYKYKQQWELAAASYQKACELKPEMMEAYSAAAVALMNAGQADKAREVLTIATTTYPDDPKMSLLLAVVTYNAGDYNAAATLFNRIKQIDPANPEPYYYLGMIAVTENRTTECVSLLGKYIAMNPSNASNLQAAKDVIGSLTPKKR